MAGRGGAVERSSRVRCFERLEAELREKHGLVLKQACNVWSEAAYAELLRASDGLFVNLHKACDEPHSPAEQPR